MSSATEPDGDQVALVHHDRVGAGLLDLAEDVAREEHGRAGVGDAVHELAHLAHLARVEAVGGLVEHEHLGTPEQHAREAEPLAHPLRVRLDLAVDRVAEAGDGERAVEVGVGEARAARLPPELQVLHPREVRHEGGGLDDGADPLQLGRAGTRACAEQEGVAAASA